MNRLQKFSDGAEHLTALCGGSGAAAFVKSRRVAFASPAPAPAFRAAGRK